MLDLILMITSPLIFFIFVFLINSLMRAQGISPEEIPKDTAAFFPGMATRFLYAFMVIRYCLMGLCMLMIISGLDEITSASGEFISARKWFVTLMLMYAGAMIMRITSAVSGISESNMWIGHLYAVFECLLMCARGRAMALLIAGNWDVLHTLGKQIDSRHTLTRITVFSFSILGFVRLADHFAPSMPDGISLVLFSVMVCIAVCYVILSVRIFLCEKKVCSILETINPEEKYRNYSEVTQ